ncbi:MAG TPA: magnesium transporter MgtC, partial [Lachnoclostridium sp.]|nr:magnesium transporter MgtC [Lachnoclostridium sp.]
MIQLEYMLRIITAGLLGFLIGSERKNRNKSAGIRTHAIVAIGSALMMVVSKYGFPDIPTSDGARIAAQVVSGIGFLGAGVIFVRNNLVNGLTTAAGIWATAGVGLALGAGQY